MAKIIYIAHKIAGDIQNNINKVLAIVKELNLSDPTIVPFAPYIVDLQALDDTIPEQRKRGMANNKAYFESGMIDELWIYSEVSAGIKQEIEWASKAKCLILFKEL